MFFKNYEEYFLQFSQNDSNTENNKNLHNIPQLNQDIGNKLTPKRELETNSVQKINGSVENQSQIQLKSNTQNPTNTEKDLKQNSA